MRNYFTLGGVSSTTYGVYISGSETFNSPERVLEEVTAPGRHGAYIAMDHRMQNYELKYSAYIGSGSFDTNIGNLRAWLLSNPGYRRLEDTYHPNEYRLAVYTGPLNVKPNPRLTAGQFDINFRVMPQRWLKSGETEVTLTNGQSITNPTLFPAKPLLSIFKDFGSSTSTVTIGSTTITIGSSSRLVNIDCETGEVYYNGTSYNSAVSLNQNDFPTLPPGATTIGTDKVDWVKVTPRWWTI